MIFNLFKSKPALRELIPEGFVDIHSHILPGIDDGAKSIEESLELIEKMKNLGFSKVIGTPHTYQGLYDNTNETIKKSFQELIKNINNNIDIKFASEYMMDNSLIKKAREKKILTLLGNFVLVEMSFIAPPRNLYEIIFEVKTNGYIPIIAHPERYAFFHNSFVDYNKLKKHGCLFQINLLSTTGYYGNRVLKIKEKLLKLSLVDYVGSDIHNLNHVREFNKKVRIKNIEKLEILISKNSDFE